jgi:hypothetical protein
MLCHALTRAGCSTAMYVALDILCHTLDNCRLQYSSVCDTWTYCAMPWHVQAAVQLCMWHLDILCHTLDNCRLQYSSVCGTWTYCAMPWHVQAAVQLRVWHLDILWHTLDTCRPPKALYVALGHTVPCLDTCRLQYSYVCGTLTYCAMPWHVQAAVQLRVWHLDILWHKLDTCRPPKALYVAFGYTVPYIWRLQPAVQLCIWHLDIGVSYT